MRLEIQSVDGHFVLFGAAVYAAGGYGEAERLGLFLAGREEIFFSEEGAEGGDTYSPPVGDAAGEGDVGGFGGADRSTEGNEVFDHVALPPSPMEMVVAPDFFASERKRAESVIMSSRTSPRMLW